jgi:hypothetical protein
MKRRGNKVREEKCILMDVCWNWKENLWNRLVVGRMNTLVAWFHIYICIPFHTRGYSYRNAIPPFRRLSPPVPMS